MLMSMWLKNIAVGLLAGLAAGGQGRTRLDPGRLCVTEGAIAKTRNNRLSVDASKMRAVASVPTAHAVEIRFTYQGATAQTSRLGSGEVRQQLGLKLRAADGCNIVYAMWRIAPQSEVVVSVKHNPGMHQSSECGNRGYRNIKPQRSVPVPLPAAGEGHLMRAEMRGSRMTVTIDGQLSWEGDLGREALTFDGPVGLRTDNVRMEFDLDAGVASAGDRTTLPACTDS